jgi:hypothetical protein
MVLVGVAHFAVGAGLYYQRTTRASSLFDSDTLVFFVPAIFAFASYFLIAWSCKGLPTRHAAAKIATATLIALAATAVSSTCTMIFMFNEWGT